MIYQRKARAALHVLQAGGFTVHVAHSPAGEDALLLANGISCRHQIRDGAGGESLHLAELLSKALPDQERMKIWRMKPAAVAAIS